MKKTLLTTVFALAISIFLIITVSAEDNNFYKNGSDFVEIEGGEFYSNIDDQDKLYYFDKATQSHTKILDDHIITMVDVEDTIYLISYVDGKSKLLEFSTTDNFVKEIALLNGIANNVCVRDSILYYILDGNIYEYNLLNNDTNIVVEGGNIDLCYFKEYNSLTYYSKNLNGDYDKKHYDFTNKVNQTELSEEISLFSVQSSDSISLMAATSYTPRLTAPSTSDPYYTSLNVFHTSGYGMVGNNGNCTCYAYGRSYENLGYKPSLSTGNAENWYNYNKNNGYYSYGKTPHLGAVAVWGKGVIGNSSDGAGHVAVVEVIDGDTVTTSESGWKSFYFKTYTRSASHSNFSYSSSYSFQGFIYVMGYLGNTQPTPKTYTVKFDANGGINAPSNITTLYDSICSISTFPTKDCHIFNGWSENPNATVATYTGTIDSCINRDITLYAVWIKGNYTVKFDANGGINAPSNITTLYDSICSISTFPTRENHTFNGWSENPNATIATYNGGINCCVNKNVTLYAVWKRHSYSITFDANGGNNALSTITLPCDTNCEITKDQFPTREGYELWGWSEYKDATVPTYYSTVQACFNEDVKLFAIWRRISYTIKFDDNGGIDGPKTITLPVDESCLIEETQFPTREGHELWGWSKYKDATVPTYYSTVQACFNEDVKLFAIWRRISYTIKFDDNGGIDGPKTITLPVDESCLIEETQFPIREGYTLWGWSRYKDATVATYYDSVEACFNEDVTLYAVWLKNATVTYDVNGGEGDNFTQSKPYKSDMYITEIIPVRKNHKFLGWSSNNNTAVAEYRAGDTYSINEDLTLYAVWENLTPYTQIKKIDNNNYSVELFNLDRGCTVIFATYQNNRLVELYPATYDGNKIPFTTTKQFDTIKVMAWSSFTTLKPLCEVNSTVIE